MKNILGGLMTFILRIIGIKRSCANCNHFCNTMLSGTAGIIPAYCSLGNPSFKEVFIEKNYNPRYCFCVSHRIDFWLLKLLDPVKGVFANVKLTETDQSSYTKCDFFLKPCANRIKVDLIIGRENATFLDTEKGN